MTSEFPPAPPAPPQPFRNLPLPLAQAYADEVAAQTQAPIGLVWATIFAALSSAIQGCRDVRVSKKLVVPTSLFVIVAAKSGERKTTRGFKFEVQRPLTLPHDSLLRVAS